MSRVCFVVGSAMAQTADDVTASAMAEVGRELQICSVYYITTSTCVGSQDHDLSNTYLQAADRLGNMANATERATGVSNAAYAAQGRLYLEAMTNAMDRNCSNIAVLLEKYAKFCQRLSRNADPQLSEWIACLRAKQQICGGPAAPTFTSRSFPHK